MIIIESSIFRGFCHIRDIRYQWVIYTTVHMNFKSYVSMSHNLGRTEWLLLTGNDCLEYKLWIKSITTLLYIHMSASYIFLSWPTYHSTSGYYSGTREVKSILMMLYIVIKFFKTWIFLSEQDKPCATLIYYCCYE